MTDEELGAFCREQLTKAGFVNCAILAKPVATKEAVERRLENSPVDAAWNKNTVLHIMDALTYFAPPASNVPIFSEIQEERQRQDAQWGGVKHDDKHSPRDWASFVGRQMFNDYDGPSRQAFVKASALCVAAIEAHDRLAQPVPEVDPDAGAKRLAQSQGIDWLTISDEVRSACRKLVVAAAEKGNG